MQPPGGDRTSNRRLVEPHLTKLLDGHDPVLSLGDRRDP